MTTREQFEQTIKARFGDLIDYRVCKNSDGEYMAWDAQVAWWAWQAASKASGQRLAAVVAENAGLKAFGDKLNDMHNDLNGEGIGIQGRAEVASQQIALEAAMDEFDTIKTPATDAFLAEVRAQGVEMYADNLDSGADDAERDGFDDAVKFLRSEASGVRLFAAQLRQGAEHE
ncbi:hypothetical protein ACM26Q_23030 [Kluyvera ascorbata]|uniref:hypothetical protein n=1 Tax=Kluyvera ascorbata TaxID=51288 RepID=UPI0039F6E8B9